jgi:hypothetical protein
MRPFGPVASTLTTTPPKRLQPSVLDGFLPAETSLAAPSTDWFPATRDISGASGRVGEENENLVYLPPETSRDLLHAVKFYDVGPPALLSIRRKLSCGFLSPLKVHRLGWARTRNLCGQ